MNVLTAAAAICLIVLIFLGLYVANFTTPVLSNYAGLEGIPDLDGLAASHRANMMSGVIYTVVVAILFAISLWRVSLHLQLLATIAVLLWCACYTLSIAPQFFLLTEGVPDNFATWTGISGVTTRVALATALVLFVCAILAAIRGLMGAGRRS